MIVKAPFETFEEYRLREESDSPYNAAFLQKCRDAAQRYKLEDDILRPALLTELKKSVPYHYLKYVGV